MLEGRTLRVVNPLYSSEQVRRIEASCLRQVAVGGLIERAALALTNASVQMLATMPSYSRVVALLGQGNNGQDALQCSRRLIDQGMVVQTFNLAQIEAFDTDSLTFTEWLALLDERCLVIDGLFGIGLNRPISDHLIKIFEAINLRACKVIAVDVPSGLNSGTGNIQGAALRADLTVSMLVDKTGLHTGDAAAYVGMVQIETLDCALTSTQESVRPAAQLLNKAWLKAQIPYRSRIAHKGTQGSVLIVGGAPDLRGAALLSALGAQAGGAGKVFVQFLRAEASETFALAMVHPSLMLFQSRGAWEFELRNIDAVVIGCGLGQSSQACDLLLNIAKACDVLGKPLVLDADALNLIAQNDNVFDAFFSRSALKLRPWVMTPHPLEGARLTGLTTADIQADRISATQAMAEKFQLAVALKGPGTVVACPARSNPLSIPSPTQELTTTAIAPFGSPALAVGGTGDVLAGLIGSLLAQGFSHQLSAQMGTTIHALAGTLWSETRPKSYGLKAEELPENIVTIMNSL